MALSHAMVNAVKMSLNSQHFSQDNSQQRRKKILLAIAGTWGVALGYLGVNILLVHTGVGMFVVF